MGCGTLCRAYTAAADMRWRLSRHRRESGDDAVGFTYDPFSPVGDPDAFLSVVQASPENRKPVRPLAPRRSPSGRPCLGNLSLRLCTFLCCVVVYQVVKWRGPGRR